ncbi:leucine-rich repeat-containing protein 34 [Sorex fumeus]|uniref:leucine-rich repeat-containing protein 34 n=1 Tax=Sorex fumeus TaxID=62283 RepID=UPI0024ADF7CC|nr:leucine-rich repeat-containing protein 34 [Sorex fumeus]
MLEAGSPRPRWKRPGVRAPGPDAQAQTASPAAGGAGAGPGARGRLGDSIAAAPRRQHEVQPCGGGGGGRNWGPEPPPRQLPHPGCALSAGLKARLEVISLNLAGNNRLIPVERLTGEDFWILCKTIKKIRNIESLDVRYNTIGDTGAFYAAELFQKHPNLRYVNLMFNDIGPEGGELIANALFMNETLKNLRMTGNKIENKGGMFFASMLQMNSSLEMLDLGDCDLGMQSLIAFATVLTQNKTLKGINLNRPILYGQQEESTVHLSYMLKENHCLIELHMCKHDIKNWGFKHLCEALYLNSSLRYLDVSCNNITRDGMKFLADVLKNNTTLEVIDLSFNRIENAGANYLSETLASHNRSLKALSVVSNNIEGEGLVALSQSMKTNPIFSYIYIWGNKFDEATCIAYADLIQTGHLQPDNTDVEPYTVDGRVYLAEVSNGLKKHYYWTPTYTAAYSHSANIGTTLVSQDQ